VAIKTTITDGCGEGIDAGVHKKPDLASGLVVYTEPYRDTIAQTKFAINDTFGADINQSATFTGTPEGVHNGIDSTLWTASALSGTWDFESTDQFKSGAKSVDGTAANNNTVAQFEKASTISTGSYVALTGWVYISDWSTGGSVKEIEIELRTAGVLQGNFINVSEYLDSTSFGVWQKIIIPLGDFNTGTVDIDQVWVRNRDQGGGAAPNFYLDDIQFEETGGTQVYSVIPDTGTIFKPDSLTISLADAYDSTLANSSVPNIKYNQLLGVSKLDGGIILRLTVDDKVRFQAILKQHLDFIQIPFNWSASGDGTNTSISYIIDFGKVPLELDSRRGDKIELIISDDLSGLLHFRASFRGSTEQIA
jgi:hypothetical protein